MRIRFLSLLALGSLLMLFAVLVLCVSDPIIRTGVLLYIALNAGLTFYRPVWGFTALLLFLPLFNNMMFCAWTDNFPPALILFFSFFSGWLLHRVRNLKLEEIATPLNRTLIAFVAMGLGSGLITILRYSDFCPLLGRHFQNMTVNLLGETNNEALLWVFRTLLVFLSGPAVFWAAIHIVTSKKIVIRSLSALAAGVALAVAFGAFQSLGHEALGNVPRFGELHRVNATFTDPNALGSFLILALPLFLGLAAIVQKIWSRILLLLITGGALYVLGCSGSRTGIMGLAIAITVAAAFYISHRGIFNLRRRNRLLIPALAPAILLVGFFPSSLKSDDAHGLTLTHRLSGTIETIGEQGVLGLLQNERWPMWRPAVKVTMEHPVSGIGLGAFHTEVPNFMKYGFRKPSYRDNANNFYLQASAEMGLIGLFFSVLVLFLMLREAIWLTKRQFQRRSDIFLSCLFCGGLASMMIMYLTGPHTLFPEVKLLFWALNGMIVAMRYRAGAIFAIAPVEDKPSPPARWVGLLRPLALPAMALLILAFFASQTADALGVLSLKERRRLHDWESSNGFYTWETGTTRERFRWTRQEASVLAPTWPPLLQTTLYVGHPDADKDPVTVQVLLDGKLVQTEVFAKPHETHSLTLLLPRTDKKQVEVGFKVSRTFSPSRYNRKSFDMRELGVLVQEFQHLDVSEAAGYGFSAWSNDPNAGPFPFRVIKGEAAMTLDSEHGSRFELHASRMPGSSSSPLSLRIYCGNRLVHGTMLEKSGWQKIILNTNARPEDSPVLLRFEAAVGADSKTSESLVRLTNLQPATGH